MLKSISLFHWQSSHSKGSAVAASVSKLPSLNNRQSTAFPPTREVMGHAWIVVRLNSPSLEQQNHPRPRSCRTMRSPPAQRRLQPFSQALARIQSAPRTCLLPRSPFGSVQARSASLQDSIASRPLRQSLAGPIPIPYIPAFRILHLPACSSIRS